MSVTLRNEILPTDLTAMMRWLANPHVAHNLNEHRQITAELRQIYDARLPVLTPLFNQGGRFWMIDRSPERPVGFLRAVYGAEKSVEMVIAIGDEALWGRGLGKKALREALKEIFLVMRKESILVHIKHGNTRSHNLFVNSGFSFIKERKETTQYRLTMEAYLHSEKDKREETLFIA